jgi:hypothetical protein
MNILKIRLFSTAINRLEVSQQFPTSEKPHGSTLENTERSSILSNLPVKSTRPCQSMSYTEPSGRRIECTQEGNQRQPHSHSCLAYELDIDDEPESLSYVLMELLTERGAEVEYHDPNVFSWNTTNLKLPAIYASLGALLPRR